ncbi:M23 family metallopeptidase [Dethiobacter alkaliphilus]|uniref:M23 family metallopeptidase n=1 Tax=Dethiobacter alkaliphilus TaxID=427926 RepID=UPI002227C449|nr:M23 family metallopeptidase [Dethiobacter alkaliphilus]MCW3489043.1 M23 family metallopeptidase [Dethiobacter alkaliphilus]
MRNKTFVLKLCVLLLLFIAGCGGESEVAVPGREGSAPLNFRTNTAGQLIESLNYLSSPLQGVGLSRWNRRLPTAPRAYRDGIHEGMDYFVRRHTPVLAAGDGYVVRADHDFVEMTLQEYNEAIAIAKKAEPTPEDIADKFLGRQVWIAHSDGVITRYAHLERVDESIRVGSDVTLGQVIGAVGNSGTRYSIVGGSRFFDGAPHLHFEVWHDGTFLGEGRPFSEIRIIYHNIFHTDN